MTVIPKQTKYKAILLNYSEEMFLEIGKYVNNNLYVFENNDYSLKKKIKFKTNNQNWIISQPGDYLLISLENNSDLVYVKSNQFKDYIEIVEEN